MTQLLRIFRSKTSLCHPRREGCSFRAIWTVFAKERAYRVILNDHSGMKNGSLEFVVLTI